MRFRRECTITIKKFHIKFRTTLIRMQKLLINKRKVGIFSRVSNSFSNFVMKGFY